MFDEEAAIHKVLGPYLRVMLISGQTETVLQYQRILTILNILLATAGGDRYKNGNILVYVYSLPSHTHPPFILNISGNVSLSLSFCNFCHQKSEGSRYIRFSSLSLHSLEAEKLTYFITPRGLS